MSSFQAQTHFCRGCYSDDYQWIGGEYTMIHGEQCPGDAPARMSSVPTKEES